MLIQGLVSKSMFEIILKVFLELLCKIFPKVGIMKPFKYKDVILRNKRIPIIKIRRSHDHLIFTIGIPVPTMEADSI